MKAEIYKFPVAEGEEIEGGVQKKQGDVASSERDEIERLRTSMKDWYTNVYGGDTPLGALVWHEVDAAMKNDEIGMVRNAAAALHELNTLRVSDIPF